MAHDGISACVAILRDLSRRGALPVLAELARQHPAPLGAMGFARASGVEAGTASRVRDELQQMGLIDASPSKQQGAITQYEIRLTPLGKQVADHVLAIDGLLRDTRKRAESA